MNILASPIFCTQTVGRYSEVLLTQLLVSLVATGNVHEQIQHHLRNEQFCKKKKNDYKKPNFNVVLLDSIFQVN